MRIAFRGYETTLLERETGESGHVEVMIASRAITAEVVLKLLGISEELNSLCSSSKGWQSAVALD